MRRVILRADGNSHIGLGHMYRLLALSEILCNDFECVFISNKPTQFLKDEISKICSSFIDLNNTLLLHTPDEIEPGFEINCDIVEFLKKDDIIVLDGYCFGKKYRNELKSKGCQVVCIDDFAEPDLSVDAVINHAPGLDPNIYRNGLIRYVCTGLDYAIMRKSFFKPFPIDLRANEAFVSLGGADFFGFTNKLVELLIAFDKYERIHVLCSSSFSKEVIETLEKIAEAVSNVKLYVNLDAVHIVNLMDKCSDAFVSSSTVLFEAYARGLRCFVGYYTKNQELIYKGFTNESKAIGLGNFNGLELYGLSHAVSNASTLKVLQNNLISNSNIIQMFKSL